MLPVLERGKMANWIAAPERGVKGQPLDFEYIRLMDLDSEVDHSLFLTKLRIPLCHEKEDVLARDAVAENECRRFQTDSRGHAARTTRCGRRRRTTR